MENNYDIFVSKSDDGFYIVTLPGAKAMLESNDFFVLDVRPYGLFAPFHIEGAVNISTIEIPDRLHEIPQDRKILIYCQFDIMSRNAGKKLVEAGFNDVYNILGGFGAWYRAGYPYVSDL